MVSVVRPSPHLGSFGHVGPVLSNSGRCLASLSSEPKVPPEAPKMLLVKPETFQQVGNLQDQFGRRASYFPVPDGSSDSSVNVWAGSNGSYILVKGWKGGSDSSAAEEPPPPSPKGSQYCTIM